MPTLRICVGPVFALVRVTRWAAHTLTTTCTENTNPPPTTTTNTKQTARRLLARYRRRRPRAPLPPAQSHHFLLLPAQSHHFLLLPAQSHHLLLRPTIRRRRRPHLTTAMKAGGCRRACHQIGATTRRRRRLGATEACRLGATECLPLGTPLPRPRTCRRRRQKQRRRRPWPHRRRRRATKQASRQVIQRERARVLLLSKRTPSIRKTTVYLCNLFFAQSTTKKIPDTLPQFTPPPP